MDRSAMWKILLIIGIILSLVAFILGWIGFGVPDWHSFQRYNGSITEYYGLWAYCQEQTPLFQSVCQRWSTAADQLFNGNRPNFISTSEGLITTGMILLSLGLFAAIVAAVLPFLAYAAAALAFMAFIFLVIGLPIFGRQSDAYSSLRGDYSYNKRYGFWLIVPTIVLEFLAALLFLAAAILYKSAGAGNIASGFGNRSYKAANNVYGGRQVRGPAAMLTQPWSANMPYGMRPAPLFGTGGMPHPMNYMPPLQTQPSLLSQYLAQQVTPSYDLPRLLLAGASSLPQPSIARAIGTGPAHNVTPAYYRFGEPVGPRFTPIVNLSGETIVGPLMRTA